MQAGEHRVRPSGPSGPARGTRVGLGAESRGMGETEAGRFVHGLHSERWQWQRRAGISAARDSALRAYSPARSTRSAEGCVSDPMLAYRRGASDATHGLDIDGPRSTGTFYCGKPVHGRVGCRFACA